MEYQTFIDFIKQLFIDFANLGNWFVTPIVGSISPLSFLGVGTITAIVGVLIVRSII